MAETTLKDAVTRVVKQYLLDLDGEMPANGIHKIVMYETERTLFDFVYTYKSKNQSNATKVLGISRATFRKKLKIFNLL